MEKYIDHFQAFFSRAENFYKNVKEHKVGAFSRLVSKSFRALKSIAFPCKFPCLIKLLGNGDFQFTAEA